MIVVNYNVASLAIAAVDSALAEEVPGWSVDVHLVDNASPLGDAAKLKQECSKQTWTQRVTLYTEETNHGFGRGNSLVLQRLSEEENPPERVLLLNPDARLSPGALSSLADFLDRRKKAAVAGCAIQSSEDGRPLTAAFRFPSLTAEFAQSVNFGPISRLFEGRQVPMPPGIPTQEVDWVAGAALMARLEALVEVGFFDPDYFLYFEEVDMMHSLKEKGWEIWHLTEAEVLHAEGASSGVKGGRKKDRRMPSYYYDSWRLYYVKNHGIWYAWAAAYARLAGWGMNCVFRSLQGHQPDGPAHFLRDFFARVLRPLATDPRRTDHPS